MNYFTLAGELGLDVLSRIFQATIPHGPLVLTYHGIGADDHSITVEEDVFKDHLRLLEQSRFDVMTLSEYFDRGMPTETVVLSFDDGTVGQYANGARLLESFGYEGVFFLIVDKIGTEGYVTWEEAEDLAAQHEVGAHTWTHPDLGPVNERDELIHEVVDVKIELENRLAGNVDHFAFPFGKGANINRDVVKLAGEHYNSICSTTGCLPNLIHPTRPCLVERIPVNDLSVTDFEQLLNGRAFLKLALRDGLIDASGRKELFDSVAPHGLSRTTALLSAFQR